MKVRIVRPSELTQEEVAEWEAIRTAGDVYDSPYYCFDFTRILSERRDDVRVIAANDAAGAHMFIPVQLSRAGLARPVGAPFSDCNGPIFHVGDALETPDILQRAGVAAYRYNGRRDLKGDFNQFNRAEEEFFFADLQGGFTDYLEARRAAYPKHFKKARRLSRQAAREAGELDLRFHEASSDTLEELVRWKREQYRRTGLHDVLSPKWARDMLQDFLTTDSDQLHGVLTTLRIGGELAAAEFGLRSGPVLHGWIAGYNPVFSSFSPGILLQERLLEAAFEAGVARAELGAGAAHYKKYYASGVETVHEGIIPATGAFGAARAACSGVWNAIEGEQSSPASRFAGRLRRRLDNILAAETTISGRLRGVVQALNKPG